MVNNLDMFVFLNCVDQYDDMGEVISLFLILHVVFGHFCHLYGL